MQEVVWVGRFNVRADTGVPAPWRIVRFDEDVPATEYRVRTWDGIQAVEALADASMALLARPVMIDLERTPVLCWRWRVDGSVRSADMKRRSGDDYAARVYVAFELRPESMGFMTRMALRAARKLYGESVPDAAINYVWDNRYPEGTALPNAYTDRTRMIVAETGDAKTHQWVWEQRDVLSDFAEHFDLPDPQITSIAVATDTDNTLAKARAGFADIAFVPRGVDCASLIVDGA
ncbi:MAG: DUF3047 domain-containing protein [Dehalococcoidia bacterium]